MTCGSRRTTRADGRSNDGGATVSVNGGETWTPETMPTSQFYHVTTTSARAVSRVRRAAGQQHGLRVEPAAAGRPGGGRRRRSGVLLGRRRGKRLHRQRSAEPGHLLRGQLRRVDHSARSPHRPGARDQSRIPTTRWVMRRRTSRSASSGRSRSCSRRPIRGRSTSARSTVEVDERGPELDEDQPRSHAPRSEDDGCVRRADHEGQHRRRDIRDDIHDRAVAEGRKRHLDGLG